MNAKTYCFTLDDNIRFLEELQSEKVTSIFESEYLKMLKALHDRFGCNVQVNMYYSYTPESLSLADCTDRFVKEFSENSSWLRFSFHAKHNDPPFPYDGKDSQLIQDFDLVTKEMIRVFGKDATTSKTTTIHYVVAGKEGCLGLKKRGMDALIGMFYDRPDRTALRYYLDEKTAALFRDRSLWRDPETDIVFARNDIVLNNYPLDEIVPFLEDVKSKSNPDNFFHIMIHEQYFYSDYEHYQPDFVTKLETALQWLQKNDYAPCFLEDRIAVL